MTVAPAVSVAMATFNGARYLAPQLESILSQTYPVAELVISDDGSRDGTLDLARDVLAASGRSVPDVTLIEEPSAGGVTANFERAISSTKHSVILLSDQDDVWERDRVAVTLAALEQRAGTLLVHGDARLVDDRDADLGGLFDALGMSPRVRAEIRAGGAFDLLMQRNLVTGATVGFRRALLDFALPFPPSWVHDEWLAIVAAALDGVALIDQPVIRYRQHGGNEIGARRIGLLTKLGRLTAPGRDRNRRLLARATALSDWVDRHAYRVPAARMDAAHEKLTHERVRSGLPRRRLRRVPIVRAEARSGRYARFGRGTADVIRDLVQPLGPSASS